MQSNKCIPARRGARRWNAARLRLSLGAGILSVACLASSVTVPIYAFDSQQQQHESFDSRVRDERRVRVERSEREQRSIEREQQGKSFESRVRDERSEREQRLRGLSMVHTTRARKEVPQAPLVERYLLDGRLAEGETNLVAYLKEHPQDEQARFGLGMLQFLMGVERLGQDFHRFGLRSLSSHGTPLPFFRLPVAENAEPQTISYEQLRKIAETFVDHLTRAEATLALIKSDQEVKLPIHFGLIKLDMNGNGASDQKESLWRIYQTLNGDRDKHAKPPNDFYITFDRGDVHWLRGYCNLLSGVLKIYLAYDSKEFFDCTAHMLFKKVASPYKYLSEKGGKRFHRIGDDIEILDVIAAVHLIRWDVLEPQRMAEALHHFEAVVAQSRLMWKWIMAETDDDHEWIPNPKQTGVIEGVRVTQEMVTSWGQIMNQVEEILKGEVLIPFWRGDENVGVNVRKVFLEPTRLDLVLWVQGPCARPYLQKGKMTSLESWTSLTRSFGSNFPGFALWFN